jgi:hypothetical protein
MCACYCFFNSYHSNTVKRFWTLQNICVCFVVIFAMVIMLRDFGYSGIIFMNLCCYNHCLGFAVKRFWALWDNIYDCVSTSFDFPVTFDRNYWRSS